MSTAGHIASNSLYSGILGGYQLLGISPTVFAARAIIAIIVDAFLYIGGQQR